MPQLTMPQFTMPQFTVPQFTVPQFPVPQFTLPRLTAPLDIPSLSALFIQAGEIKFCVTNVGRHVGSVGMFYQIIGCHLFIIIAASSMENSTT